MKTLFIAITLFSAHLSFAETLVRPNFLVPTDPMPYLARGAAAIDPHGYLALSTNMETGTVIINGDLVLEKDAYIYADTVLLYGTITTLRHNLTIICRKIYFPSRRLEPTPHIKSVSGAAQKRVQDVEKNIIPGKVNIIAGEIYGLPIISNSRSLAQHFTPPESDAPTEINISYGLAEFEDTRDVFDQVFLGIAPNFKKPAKVERSLKPLYLHFIELQKEAKALIDLVSFRSSVLKMEFQSEKDRVPAITEGVSLLINEKQRSIRQRILSEDSEMQRLANSVDPSHSKAILDLFVPDEISVKKIEACLQNSSDPSKNQTLLDSRKWITDMTFESGSVYYKNCDLRPW